MLSFIKVSHGVYQALGALDPFESTGIDGIGPRVLKFCSAALVDMFITYFHYHYLVVVYLRSGKHKSSPLFLNLAQSQMSLIFVMDI